MGAKASPFVAGLALIALLGQYSATPAEEGVEELSLIQLIARPLDHKGKVVSVVGFCRLEFEGTALYLHEEDFERMITKNAIWLKIGWPVPEQWRNLSDEYCRVEAVFETGMGHFARFSGTLTAIRKLRPQESRAEVERQLRLYPPVQETP